MASENNKIRMINMLACFSTKEQLTTKLIDAIKEYVQSNFSEDKEPLIEMTLLMMKFKQRGKDVPKIMREVEEDIKIMGTAVEFEKMTSNLKSEN